MAMFVQCSQESAVSEDSKPDFVAKFFHETWSTNDSVHGTITLPKYMKLFIDHKIFQRLRDIKQLGLCEYVYVGATHTRFSHSIGTCYLAYELCQILQKRSPKAFGDTEEEQVRTILCICTAALLHDIGHPAFSHMFEIFMQGIKSGQFKTVPEDTSVNDFQNNCRESRTLAIEKANRLVELAGHPTDDGEGIGPSVSECGDGNRCTFTRFSPQKVLAKQTDSGVSASSPSFADSGAAPARLETVTSHGSGRGDSEKEKKEQKPWSHETASLLLLKAVFEDLEEHLEEAGITERHQTFIAEMIEPPKKELTSAFLDGTLHEVWPELIKGRDLKDAWMFEIVSNWRCGLDVDRFDYFERDAKHLGIAQTFERARYFSNLRLEWHYYNKTPGERPKPDDEEKYQKLFTLASMRKDADILQKTFFEQRKELHKKAYQHKAVKKMEMHMLNILAAIAPFIYVRNSKGKYVNMIDAANLQDFDAKAYCAITDSLVSAALRSDSYRTSGELGQTVIQEAQRTFQHCVVDRNMMREAGTFDALWFSHYQPDYMMGERRKEDEENLKEKIIEHAWLPGNVQTNPIETLLTKEEVKGQLKVCAVDIHQGSKTQDPMAHVLLIDSKTRGEKVLGKDTADPLSQMLSARDLAITQRFRFMNRTIYVFWVPPTQISEKDSDKLENKLSEKDTYNLLVRLNKGVRNFVNTFQDSFPRQPARSESGECVDSVTDSGEQGVDATSEVQQTSSGIYCSPAKPKPTKRSKLRRTGAIVDEPQRRNLGNFVSGSVVGQLSGVSDDKVALYQKPRESKGIYENEDGEKQAQIEGKHSFQQAASSSENQSGEPGPSNYNSPRRENSNNTESGEDDIADCSPTKKAKTTGFF